jgi:hypothetical protein
MTTVVTVYLKGSKSLTCTFDKTVKEILDFMAEEIKSTGFLTLHTDKKICIIPYEEISLLEIEEDVEELNK